MEFVLGFTLVGLILYIIYRLESTQKPILETLEYTAKTLNLSNKTAENESLGKRSRDRAYDKLFEIRTRIDFIQSDSSETQKMLSMVLHEIESTRSQLSSIENRIHDIESSRDVRPLRDDLDSIHASITEIGARLR